MSEVLGTWTLALVGCLVAPMGLVVVGRLIQSIGTGR